MCKYLSVVILVATLLAPAVSAQSYYAYTEKGAVRELPVQDSIISAKLASSVVFWTTIYAQETALAGDVPPEALTDGFDLLRVRAGYDPDSLVQRLREREDILFANLSFLDRNGQPDRLPSRSRQFQNI